MSLPIDTGKVKAVLLPDGEWYQCKSFELDSYEFMDAAHVEPGLGFRMEATLGSSLTVTRIISGPLSSIKAVEQEI